jgi:hypothetical protein
MLYDGFNKGTALKIVANLGKSVTKTLTMFRQVFRQEGVSHRREV